MKVITLSEVANRLRQRRQGRGYLGKFIEECTIEDAIPLDRIKQAREEIENIGMFSYLEFIKEIACNDSEFRMSKKFATAILDKLIAESEDNNGKN